MKIFNITELVGGTPFVRLHNIEKEQNLGVLLVGKLEYFNQGRCQGQNAVND